MHSLLMLLLMTSTPAPAAGEQPASPMPSPKIFVSRQTPESKLRPVSSEEVKAALERIQQRQAGTQPVTPTPAASPGRHKVEVYNLELKPKSEIPIQQPLQRVAPPKKSGPPPWTPKWEAKKQFATTAGPQLKLDYQWKGIVASVEMTSPSPDLQPIRVLLSKEGAGEILSPVAGTEYRITIQGRLPENTVWIPLYTFENVIFKQGHAQQLQFPASMVKDLKEHIAMAEKERLVPVSTPKPVELEVTPVTGVRQ